jgi:hypothetical protein
MPIFVIDGVLNFIYLRILILFDYEYYNKCNCHSIFSLIILMIPYAGLTLKSLLELAGGMLDQSSNSKSNLMIGLFFAIAFAIN